MEDEAAGKLGPRQPQDLRSVAVRTVAPTEGDLFAVVVEDAGVGVGDLSRVTRHVADDLLGAGQRRLRVDHPAVAGCALEKMTPERKRDSKGVLVVGCLELAEQFPPEDLAQLVVGEEEAWFTGDPLITLIREATAGDEAMSMGVKEKLLVPSVELGGKPDPRPQVAMGDFEERF
jgi:hypothetical protein